MKKDEHLQNNAPDTSSAGNSNKGKYSELPMRIASALVLAIIALYATYAGGLTFSLLALVLSVFIYFEYAIMTASKMPFRVAIFGFGFLCILWASWFLQNVQSGIIIALLGVVALNFWEMVIRRSAWGALGVLYAGLFFVAFCTLRGGSYGLVIILLLFAAVWGADTCAYFSGKTFGGPKLAPKISPGKTWSGFLGGVIGACLFTSLLLHFFGFKISAFAIGLTIAIAIVAQLGDLFESALKRHFSVKDSGWIIPGHGGVLDRIDGLIFAAVGVFLLGYAIIGGSLYEGLIPNWLGNTFLLAE